MLFHYAVARRRPGLKHPGRFERLGLQQPSGNEPADERWLPLSPGRVRVLGRAGHEGGKRRFISLIGHAEMLEDLADAPAIRLGMLVELCRVERSHKRGNPLARVSGFDAQLLVQVSLQLAHVRQNARRARQVNNAATRLNSSQHNKTAASLSCAWIFAE